MTNMPNKPQTSCKSPRCPNLTDPNSVWCTEHKKQADHDYRVYFRNNEDVMFYNSIRWKRIRRIKINMNPLCERCEKEGRIVSTDQVHHIVDRHIRPDLELELTNLESLCTPCHSRETDALHGGQ